MRSTAPHRPALPRLTGSVFGDLAIWMVGLGLVTGLVFPGLVVLLGMPPSRAFTGRFFTATVLAGLLVGGLNYILARVVVGRRLRLLAEGMRVIGATVRHATETGDWSGYEAAHSLLEVDSTDELGEAAAEFNQLVTELEQSHELEEAVRDILRSLSSHLALRPLAQAALEELTQRVGARAGAILVVGDSGPRVVACQGALATDALAASAPIRALLAGSGSEETSAEGGAETGGELPDDVLVLPVRYRDRILGAIALDSTPVETNSTSRQLEILISALGIALHNALTHEEAELLARLDPLTRCANRRGGREVLDRCFDGVRDAERALGVMIIDLDDFKAVNDTHGHDVGDAVLVNAAKAARACLRPDDALVRYGGEEFLAILPGIDLQQLWNVAQRVRTAIEESGHLVGSDTVRVTASIGMAGLPSHGAPTVEALLQQADAALYTAKAEGRNRVIIASRTARPTDPVTAIGGGTRRP